MADCGDRLTLFRELAHDIDHLLVQAQIFGRAAAGNRQRVVLAGVDVVEGRVQGELVAGLFRVGLVTFEIVNGRLDALAG